MADVIGFDGWTGGWVGVALSDGRVADVVVAGRLAEIVHSLDRMAVIGVDIPIGLPSTPPRRADVEAKRLLGARASTVYFTPPRAVLEAATYTDARRVSRELFGRGVSAQSYALRSRILEVDELAHDPRFHEIHPELAFSTMGDATPAPPKKTWAGHVTRRRLLEGHGIVLPDDLGQAGSVPPDDILDAAAVAWSAARVAAGEARCLPAEDPPLDPATEAPVPDGRIWF